MSISRRQLLRAFTVGVALPFAACHRDATGLRKENIMQKYSMKNYAVGRFLIDLPVAATDVSRSQRILGTDIEWKAATEEQYRTLLSMRVNKLRGTSPANQLLISDAGGAIPQSRIMIFEENIERNGLIQYEAYRYITELGGYFFVSESAERKKISIIIPWVNRILKLVQPRDIDPKMTDRGTCIDHGVIFGIDPAIHDNISIMASISNVTLGLTTQVISRVDDGPSLLQRAERINWLPDAKMLRKSQRKIAGLNGAEFSFKDVPSDNYTPYSLQWEYEGQSDSIAAPRMEASIDTKGPITISEEELLGLWDAVLESIRLRPGAV